MVKKDDEHTYFENQQGTEHDECNSEKNRDSLGNASFDS